MTQQDPTSVGHDEEELVFDPPPRRPPPPPLVPPPPPGIAPKKVESLEDLYHYFPHVGDGQYRVRVERTAPKNYGGQLIAGWLGDLDEKITLDGFKDRFGGGRYSVCIMGPSTRGDDVQIKQLSADIEVLIPGPPAAGSFPFLGEEYNMQGMVGMRGGAPMEATPVALERLKQEERRSERERAAYERMSTPSDHVVSALKDQSQQSLIQIKELAESKAEILREQNARLIRDITDKDTELKSLRDTLVHERSQAGENLRRSETELERRLKESFDKTIAELKDNHQRQISDMKESHGKELRDIEARHQGALNEASRRYNDETTRIQNEARNERERIRAEHERAEKQIKETYDQRVSDLKSANDRELVSIREQRDNLVQSVKTQYETMEKVSKEGAGFRFTTMEAELTRVRSENESLRRDNERLVKASVKDPVTFLTETRAVAENLLGMVSSDEVAAAKAEEGEFDWKKEGAKALMGFIGKLPETAKGVATELANVRAQNQQHAAAAQQMQEQQSQQMVQVGPGGQPRRRRMAPPPPLWQGPGSPPPYTGPVQGAEIPFQQPYATIPRHQPAPPGQVWQPASDQPQQQQVQVQAQPQQPPPQQQQVALQPEPQQQPAQATQVTQDGIEIFITELDKAIRTDVITAEMFAKGFVDQVGKKQTQDFMGQVSADEFLEQLDAIGRGGAITTREGRAYVHALWAKAKELIEAA